MTIDRTKMRLDSEQLKRLRTEMPEAYEELLEARDIKARLWNALVWYGSNHKKFTGKLSALARDLADNDNPTQMDTVVKQMQRDGWFNCESY